MRQLAPLPSQSPKDQEKSPLEKPEDILNLLKEKQDDLRKTDKVIGFKVRMGQNNSLPTKIRRRKKLIKEIEQLSDQLSKLHGGPEDDDD